MSYKSLNQKGFAALEAVLVIVIIAILAGTGYYVFQANSKTNDTQTAAHNAAESAVVTSTTSKSAVAAGAQSKKTYVNLLDAYKKNATANKDWDVTYVSSKAASDEFTAAFKAAATAGTAWDSNGGAFCTDNVAFDGFLVDKAALDGDTATVTLAQTVKGKKSSDYATHIKLTLKYADKSWAIDKQECAAA